MEFDLRLLVDDSAENDVRVWVNPLFESDIDDAYIAQNRISKKRLAEWMRGKYGVPLSALRDLDSVRLRMKALGCRRSNSIISVPAIDESMAYFLGVVFGDGHIVCLPRKKGGHHWAIVIQKKRTDYSAEYLPKLVQTVFGVTPKIYFTTRKSELVTVALHSKIAVLLLSKCVGFSTGRKTDKQFQFISKLPPDLQVQFLAGMFDTDGGRSGGSFAFCNSIETATIFAKQVLETLGIPTKTYFQKKGNFSWRIVHVPRRYKQRFLELLPVRNESKFATGEI